MSNSVRPHRQQPTRLPLPWDPPGKNTGVGCHFFLQCMKVKSETEVAQSCKTLRDPMDCSLSGSSIHGIFQARVLVIWLLKYRSISSLIGKYCLPIHTSWPPRPFQDPCPKLLTIKRQEDQQQRLSRTLSQCSQSLTKPHSTLISALIPWWLTGKETACPCKRCEFDPWVGKIPGRSKWQYSCLGNPMDRGAWGLQSMESQTSQSHLATTHQLMWFSLSSTFIVLFYHTSPLTSWDSLFLLSVVSVSFHSLVSLYTLLFFIKHW